MATELVGIKVKIGQCGVTGCAKYPDFSKLACVQASPLDWSKYVDVHGLGWHYDCCGHQEDEDGSPAGMQWGMLIIPETFADEAVA